MKKPVKILLFIVLLIGVIFLGNVAFNVAQVALNITTNENTTERKLFEFKEHSIEYDGEWIESKGAIGETVYRTLENRNRKIQIAYIGTVNNQTSDYLQESNRQELYDSMENQLKDTYSANGLSMIDKSNKFVDLNNNFYYSFFELRSNYYTRTYMILDANKSNSTENLYGFQVVTNKKLDASDEQAIINLFNTIK